MKRYAYFLGVIGLALYGCGSSPNPDAGSAKPDAASSAAADSSGSSAPADSSGTSATVPPAPAVSSGVQTTPGAPTKSPAGTNKHAKAPDSPTAAEGWNVSPLKPEELARATDAKMASLKGVSARTNVSFHDLKGRGITQCEVDIKAPKTFRLQYPVIGGKSVGLARHILIADGSQFVTQSDDGLTPKQPVSELKIPSTAPLPDWIYQSPQFMFSAITGGKPLSELVDQVRKLGSYNAMRVEERSFEYKGRTFHQQRLVIRITPPNKLHIDVIVVVDKDFGLPVSMNALTSLVQTRSMFDWDCQWNLQPNQKFPPDSFVIPYRVDTVHRT